MSQEASQNIIPADTWEQPQVNFSATDSRHPAGLNEVYNVTPATATLTRPETALTINKEFIPPTINGGGKSRVRITISNPDGVALPLNGLPLTDVSSSPDLARFSDVSPSFTDQLGNSNGCFGGTFTGRSGDHQISLQNARMDGRLVVTQAGVYAGGLVNRSSVTAPGSVLYTITVRNSGNVDLSGESGG
ncbi:hypothetical protein HOY34_05045 [Xinfangfangia sp. D13-10-4-6]|uniref:DUF7933 domain-containing protein n=1 Tax=Pseudogemmobacter hezensis TaxID=2737662 RepID=UPI0015545D44|nr:hypothetical protein [Pseudogemmobacter hezensis]NPD14568.1 hypothetical protein [Pseudogemmobacter hezensis]